MKISVVIPCYNPGRFLSATLQSVARQSRKADEVIIIDDGSTDGSLAAIPSCGLDVTVLRAGHRNAAAARDVGIREAAGDWIAFQDAHDLWNPIHLEEAERTLRGTSAVAYAANVDVLHPDGRRDLQMYPPPFGGIRRDLTDQHFIETYGRGYFYANPAKLIRRDRLIEVELHDEGLRWRHDIDLWLRVIHGKTWCFNPKVTVTIRLPVGDDLSANVARTAFFNLKVLLKNRRLYEGPVMNRLIRKAARRAISSAFLQVDDQEQRALSSRLALPWLNPIERFALSLVSQHPGVVRTALRLRRRLRTLLSSEFPPR